jgi:hypothetical protein
MTTTDAAPPGRPAKAPGIAADVKARARNERRLLTP